MEINKRNLLFVILFSFIFLTITLTTSLTWTRPMTNHTTDTSVFVNCSLDEVGLGNGSCMSISDIGGSDGTRNITYENHISSTGASHTYINQGVTTGSSPSFPNINIGNKITHTGDTDTYIAFTTNGFELRVGNSLVMSIDSTWTTLHDRVEFRSEVNFTEDTFYEDSRAIFQGGSGNGIHWDNYDSYIIIDSGDDMNFGGSGDYEFDGDVYADDYEINSPVLFIPIEKTALDYFTTTSEERMSIDGSYNHSNIDDELVLVERIKLECEEILNKTTGSYYTGNCQNVTILSKSLGRSDELQRDAIKELKDKVERLEKDFCVVHVFGWCLIG